MAKPHFVGGVVALLLCSVASADLIQYTFTGNITDMVNPGGIDPALSGVMVGDTFTVSYVFDSNAADLLPADPIHGDYQGIVAVWLNIGGVNLSGDATPGSTHSIGLEPGFEEYETTIVFRAIDVNIDLDNNTESSVFMSDALPGLALPFDGLASSRLFDLSPVATRGDVADIDGQITGFRAQVVPAPGAAGVVMLLSLVARRRRR